MVSETSYSCARSYERFILKKLIFCVIFSLNDYSDSYRWLSAWTDQEIRNSDQSATLAFERPNEALMTASKSAEKFVLDNLLITFAGILKLEGVNLAWAFRHEQRWILAVHWASMWYVKRDQQKSSNLEKEQNDDWEAFHWIRLVCKLRMAHWHSNITLILLEPYQTVSWFLLLFGHSVLLGKPKRHVRTVRNARSAGRLC